MHGRNQIFHFFTISMKNLFFLETCLPRSVFLVQLGVKGLCYIWPNNRKHKHLFSCFFGWVKGVAQLTWWLNLPHSPHSQKIIFLNMKFVQKVYIYLIPYQSGIIALSVAVCIILFVLVNQELCHVLCDEAKSRLCHFLYILEIVMKVSNNEAVYCFCKKLIMRTIMKKSAETSFRMISIT